MALNDSLSDMLARIKNAHQANKVSTLCLKSKLNLNVLSVLKDEGYIRDFKKIDKRINKNIVNKITLEAAVKNRDSYGGTSPENIKKEIIFSKEKWCND